MSSTKQGYSKTIPFADLEQELGAASERYEEGTAHARATAKVAAGNVKHAIKVGVFNASFGLSYGLVFSTVFLTELLPEDSTVRRGLEEGADAALEAHARLKGRKQEHDLDEEDVESEEAEDHDEDDEAAEAARSRPAKKKRIRVRNRGGKRSETPAASSE
ncbi:MAG: hypothetical protein ACAI35_04910 [Candidatus Methylacidiphilales bacterium]|nr:hypothetical protein [Candidatus Methylacidiphilales bacterium]